MSSVIVADAVVEGSSIPAGAREELEVRARKALEHLPEDFRPVVAEFAGSPKAGKSTTIEIVAHFFHRMRYRVYAPSEGASKRTPYHLRRNLVAFNSWTLNYAVSELLSAYYGVDRPHLILLDRGPFDSIAWMGVLKARGQLDADGYDVVKRFALHPEWSQLVSRLYLFTCDPETSLDRENALKLIRSQGTAMNPDMLGQLLEEYEAAKAELTQYPLFAVDTTRDTSPLSTSLEIAEDVVTLFEEQT